MQDHVSIPSASRSYRVRQRGQGMTEYIIIVALIAIAAIAAFTFFGSTIRHQVGGIAHELSGKSAKSDIKAADTNAGKITDDANTKKNMKKYTNANAGQK